jgi:hypothetical protein
MWVALRPPLSSLPTFAEVCLFVDVALGFNESLIGTDGRCTDVTLDSWRRKGGEVDDVGEPEASVCMGVVSHGNKRSNTQSLRNTNPNANTRFAQLLRFSPVSQSRDTMA